MKELSNILATIYYINLGATATIALILISKYKKSHTIYFCYFVIYIFLMEIVAKYPSYIDKFEWLSYLKDTRFNNNYWYYTIFWSVASGFFYSYYFQKVLVTKRFKNILKYSRYGFMLLSVIIIILDFDGLFTINFPYINYLNTALILLASSLFLIEILSLDSVTKFYQSIDFYIASNLLIWIIITTPIYIFFEYYNEYDMDFVYLIRVIMGFSNIFMYTCFAIGLIVSKPQLNE